MFEMMKNEHNNAQTGNYEAKRSTRNDTESSETEPAGTC